MAITLHSSTAQVIGLDEFIDHVQREVDFNDLDSIAAAAPMFRALANDQSLVVSRLNDFIRRSFSTRNVAGSAQVIYLGRGDHFYLRANVWPSAADMAAGRMYDDQLAYSLAHDHNYNFMTTTHFGPGYVTEVYEYDPDKVEGYVGEFVAFRPLGRIQFKPDEIMIYRANRDMHIQHPPESLSISLNLMITTAEAHERDQYFFDLESSTITAFPQEPDSSLRISMIEMAAIAGDANTQQLLSDIAASHPCRRTRLQSYEALTRLAPEQSEGIWEKACRDREALVRNAAERHLSAMAHSLTPPNHH